MKLSIIIPVFNEKKTIEEILERVISAPAFGFEKEIVVVDDCSTDGTSELLEKLKEKFKFLLLRHEQNLGKGAAIRTGLNYVSGDIVLIQDADLEYNPKDYQKILKPILEGKTKVVYGSRNLNPENKPSSKIYNFGRKFLSFFFNLFFKTKLTDVMTCYKVFKKEVIFPSELSENRFGFDCEITAKIVKKGVQIFEVPISYHPRSFKEGKKIKIKDGLRSIYVILKCYFSGKKKLFFEIFFLLGSIFLFLLFKISHLSFRFGDGNAYFYMAKTLFDGNLPYRDFFFADPPFLILFLAPFEFIFQKNLLILQAIPIILESANAILLYLILRSFKNPLAFLVPLVYLFSFTVLATSDYLTGIQLTIFLTILAILLYQKKKIFASGFVFNLAVLTKLYALPALLGFICYLLLKERQAFLKFILGAFISFLLILCPFLFISFKNSINYLIFHHLHRPPGLNKIEVITFFLKREWFFLFFGILGIFVSKKKNLIFPFLLVSLFLLFFQDLYYVYLAYLFPFLIIFSFSFFNWAFEASKENKLELATISIFIYFIFFALSFSQYYQEFFPKGRFLNAVEIARYLQNAQENFEIYGSHEVAPLISLLSQRKLFDNRIDTNPQSFASGAQNLDRVSERAVEQGIYLIARISDYPEYNIRDFGYQGYFKEEIFKKYCQEDKKFPSTSQETDNFIGIYRCKK